MSDAGIRAGGRSVLAERPHQRLLRQGAAALSDRELLAVLLGSGLRGEASLEVAARVLRCHGGLGGLGTSSAEVLGRLALGPTVSAILLAAVELASRLARAGLPARRPLSHPQAVASYLGLKYRAPGQEIMGALFLDTRQRLIGEKEIYRGTLNRAAVEPRAVLKEGLLRDAAGFLLFHTHPSGDPSPSAEDLAFTRRIAQSGDLIGLRLVDHLILGSGKDWISLRQRGGW